MIIGFATRTILAGEHVHVHNTGMSENHFVVNNNIQTVSLLNDVLRNKFKGIVRSNGQVATRNYIGILTTVSCTNIVAKLISEQFYGHALDAFPNIDGIVALTHSLGCGGVQDGDGMDILRRTIAGYARHPNFGAVIILGLGCENNQFSRIVETENLKIGDLLKSFIVQELGGIKVCVDTVVKHIKYILPIVNQFQRQTVSASHISIGLQCGGSDGYSGITANPALGVAVDLLIKAGGTAILSETPEIYGAEQLLINKAITPTVAEKLINRINWWKFYLNKTGGKMNNNPSPGNKIGGLTTILEKSSGAISKAGTTDLVNVVKYAESIKDHGLVFMDTPGYDPVSITGQIAGGANIICFTTGRGSVYECKPVPNLKLATNTQLFDSMNDDMDINCGQIITNNVTIEEMGHMIFETILNVASGQLTKSEKLTTTLSEISPWQIDAIM
jgi:altronate hydrolase